MNNRGLSVGRPTRRINRQVQVLSRPSLVGWGSPVGAIPLKKLALGYAQHQNKPKGGITMRVHIRWNLAKQLIATVERDGIIIAMRRVHAARLLSLCASRDLVEALRKGDFVMDGSMVIVEIPNDIITLTVDNCPNLNT